MKNYAKYAVFIALATIAAVSVLRGRAAVAEGNSCNSRVCYYGTSIAEGSVWRMKVSVNEAAYVGPSTCDRVNHHWTRDAKRTYRWTSVTMPLDTDTSTRLLTISAALIGNGVPPLQQGDIVDVYVVAQEEVDYTEGRASMILRRACAAGDEVCMGGLRKTQNGRESGVEAGGGYRAASNRKRFPSVANFFRAALLGRCREDVR